MRRYAPLLLLIPILLIGYYWFGPDHPAEEKNDNGSSELTKDDTSSLANAKGTPRVLPPRLAPFPETITLLPAAASADALNSSDTTIEDDLTLIHSLLRSHRSALGANPVGLNDEITSALTGKNRKGAASLAKNHPAISEQGELLDRWGTPYRFHAYSGRLLEVSSAGPDKKFFTEDDLRLRE